MRRAFAWLCVVASLVGLMQCKPTADSGSTCPHHGKIACAGDRAALFCENGTWVEIACRGPRGCTDNKGTGPRCDQALGDEGEQCLNSSTHACSVDHRRALVCKDSRWALWFPCKGAEGCSFEGTTVACDTTVADVGEVCETPGRGACSSDHKFLLVCVDTKWGRVNSCRGPKGCSIDNAAARCDESVALENDPCDTPDERTCAMDGKSQLVCKSQKYAKEKDCKRPCMFTSHRDPPRCDY